MYYLFFAIITGLFIIIAGLLKKYQSSKSVFQKKIVILEDTISELMDKLKIKNESIIISDELFKSVHLSQKEMSSKILDANYLLLENMFDKKDDLT